LLRRTGQSGSQTAIRHAVISQCQLAFELALRREILEAEVTRAVFYVADAIDFFLHFSLAVAANHICRNTVHHRPESKLATATLHLFDLGPDVLGRIAVHQVTVAVTRDHSLGVFALAARVKRRPRLANRLRLKMSLLNLVIAALVAEFFIGPHAAHHLDELARALVALIVRDPSAAELTHLFLPPPYPPLQPEAAVRDVIDVRGHLGYDGGKPEARPNCVHQLYFLSDGSDCGSGCPAFEHRRGRAFYVVEVQLG